MLVRNITNIAQEVLGVTVLPDEVILLSELGNRDYIRLNANSLLNLIESNVVQIEYTDGYVLSDTLKLYTLFLNGYAEMTVSNTVEIEKGLNNRLMILQGYAGTGKTSVVSALVKTLPLFNYKFLLLAPTGRAAKVISNYTGHSAFTLHKIIYKQVANPTSGQLLFKRVKNYSKNTIFVVDEASMLSEGTGYGDNGLLKDLLAL